MKIYYIDIEKMMKKYNLNNKKELTTFIKKNEALRIFLKEKYVAYDPKFGEKIFFVKDKYMMLMYAENEIKIGELILEIKEHLNIAFEYMKESFKVCEININPNEFNAYLCNQVAEYWLDDLLEDPVDFVTFILKKYTMEKIKKQIKILEKSKLEEIKPFINDVVYKNTTDEIIEYPNILIN